MKIIFYGAVDCKKCEALKRDLKALGVRFEFVDANAPETQDQCDHHNVDQLPHVVQINPDTGDTLGEWIGTATQNLLQQLRKQ